MRPGSTIRFWFSISAPSSAGVILTDWEYASVEVSMLIFAILTLLLIPTNLAAIFARMSARDRLQLRAEGLKSKDAYPGVERILNTLHERVLQERIRLGTALLATGSLFAIWELETGETLGTMLVSSAVFLGAISLLNTFRLEGSIPMRSRRFPLLSLHAPTLHDSTLTDVLTDVLFVHLDPETASDWDEWLCTISSGVRDEETISSAVETLLVALHLNARSRLDEEEMMSMIRSVFKVSAMDTLTDPESKFNIDSLRRLLAHTRAWQPGLFRLIDRLQDSAPGGHLQLNETGWRMDLDLPPRCSDGQADLFVMLHNGGESEAKIEVEIIAAEGEPELQTLRVSAPRHQRKSSSTLAGLLDSALVLWIGVAWPTSESGSHPVQVTLRDQEGITVTSMVVQTTLTSRLHPESAGMRMTDAAEEVRRLALSVSD